MYRTYPIAFLPLLLACLPAQKQEGAKTKFSVHQHGFNFVNYFEGDMLVDLPIIGRVDLGDSSYGLCGGMSYSAADTFFAGGKAPDCVSPANGDGPAEIQPGQPLRSYLYDRQIDTMKADNAFMVRRLISWSWHPIKTSWGVTGLHVLSDREFKGKIHERLDDGKPVPLCLIKADADDYLPGNGGLVPEGFTKNHQVLAIGYRWCKEGQAMKAHWAIDVYDPNYPDEVHSLHYSEDKRMQSRLVRSNGQTVNDPDDIKAHKVGSFRGFFVTPYTPKVPYWCKPDVRALADLSRLHALKIDERPDDAFDEPGARTEDARALARKEAAAERAEEPVAHERAKGKGGKGKGSKGGLGGLQVPPVTAEEKGTTAIAIRGKPPHGYTVAPGPVDYVRLGRVVIVFPAAVKAKTHVEVVDGERSAVSGYGAQAFDLLPGSYGVKVSGRLVDVVVAAMEDCRIECGALKVEVGKGTSVQVLDADEKTVLVSAYGDVEVALPAGKYFVAIQNKREAVEIKSLAVTEF